PSVHPGEAIGKAAAAQADTSDIPAVPAPPIDYKNTTPPKFDPSTAKVVSRSTYDTVYAGPGGTKDLTSSTVPMTMQDSRGSWSAISTNLLQDPVGGYEDPNQPLSPSFAATTGGQSDYSVSVGGHVVSFSMLGTATVDASTPTTADLGPTD